MRLLHLQAFLPLCLVISVCGIVQVPIQHTIVSPVKLSEGGSVVEYHVVQVEIGQPAQTFNLTLDLDMYYAYVFDSKLEEATCKGVVARPRRFFDRSQSKTYKELDYDFPFLVESDAYFDYCDLTENLFLPDGALARDVVQLGSAVTDANIAVIEQTNSSLQSFWPSDGLLGLIRRNPIYETSSTIIELASKAGAPVAVLYGGDDSASRPGVLTLGGADTQNCDAKWIRFPQKSQDEKAAIFGGNISGPILDNWHASVKRFRLGTYHTSATLVATVSQGSKARAPSDIFKAVVSVIGAEYDFASDEYVVECTRVQSLPPLVVDFEDFAYHVPPSDYVKNLVPRKDNKCTLLIEESQGDLIRIFDMGWQMLKGYCWMFDYGKNELAFAKATR